MWVAEVVREKSEWEVKVAKKATDKAELEAKATKVAKKNVGEETSKIRVD